MKKVSLIIPCYNCVPYAETMQGSILTQDYDNIEVILVNDGSIDDTERTLLCWVEKFKKRGFEAKYLYKNNGGVTSAINVGLKNFTGDYICFLDHDDRLESCYVSDMVNYLDKNLDHNWVRCDANVVMESDPFFPFRTELDRTDPREYPSFLIRYLSGGVPQAIWTSMIRSEYLKSCIPSLRLPEGLPIQENPIHIPLAFAGDPGLIKKPNYWWYIRKTGASSKMLLRSVNKDDINKGIKTYMNVRQSAFDEVEKLSAKQDQKKLYNSLIFLNYIKMMDDFILDTTSFDAYFSEWVLRLVSMANDIFKPPVKISYTDALVCSSGLSGLVIERILNLEPLDNPMVNDRFILYGFGRCGKYWFEKLKYINRLPEEIWDISADGSDKNTVVPLVYPHWQDYTPDKAANITVLTLVYERKANDQIVSQFKQSGFKNVLGFYDSLKAVQFMVMEYLLSKYTIGDLL